MYRNITLLIVSILLFGITLNADEHDVGKAMRYYAMSQRLFSSGISSNDQRNPDNRTLLNTMDLIDQGKWQPLKWWYDNLTNPQGLAKKTIPEGEFMRIIAEIRVPGNLEEYANQISELDWFRNLGYEYAVVAYYGETDLQWLAPTLDYARNKGWKLIMAPAITPANGAYIQPQFYRNAFSIMAPRCEFALSGWGALSPGRYFHAHHEEPNWGDSENATKRDLNAIHTLIRQYNSDIPIVGEVWYHILGNWNYFITDYTTGAVLGSVGFVDNGTVPSPSGFYKHVDRDPAFAYVTGVKLWGDTSFDDYEPDTIFQRMRYVTERFEKSGLYRGCILMISATGNDPKGMLESDYRHKLDVTKYREE